MLEQQLRRSGVWQVLHKPVPLGQLVQCVEHALSWGRCPSSPPDSHTAAPTDPVHAFFNGNQALFAAYRATCLQQFASDLLAGDQAAHQSDYAALRHLGHSLKSVLSILGHPLPAQLARISGGAGRCRLTGGSPAILAMLAWASGGTADLGKCLNYS